jgi:transcriptional regulator with XRE-family HTH domain
MPSGALTLRRRRLGIDLRRLRESSGYTIERVAQALDCSHSKISRIETGQVSATWRDVRDILDVYGVDPKVRDELIQIARDARKKGWWHEYGDVPVPPGVSFESEAHSMSIYAALLVPGLLQTADYARAVLTEIHYALPSDEIDRRVDLRIARQSRLREGTSPKLWVVIDEAALRRRIGGSEVMRAQLEHLVEVASSPNVTLQALPFTAGGHAALDGPFIIMGFPDPGDPNVVYIEMTTSDLWHEDPASVSRYDTLFDHLRATALPTTESLALFAKVAKEV